MSGASDKARFYLEQSVPELREWERREIFSKEEITSITAKRSAFEHVLSARGSQPSDYAQYAEYEMNLDALRRKRVKRKGVKATAHTGQQRIFLILDRATRKFHGDVGLWLLSIDYARKQKANKKVLRILTEVLRMHPTKPELWIYAAKYAIDVQADMKEARSFLQRGLRFCKTSRLLYLEYARLEMSYIAKIIGRRKILGLDKSESALLEAQRCEHEKNENENVIALPVYTSTDLDFEQSLDAKQDGIDLNQGLSTPAMTGAIPLAIFNASMKQFNHDQNLGEQFFDMIANFDQIPCTTMLLNHIVKDLLSTSEFSIVGLSCQCRLSLIGISVNSPQYPSTLSQVLKDIKSAMTRVSSARELAEKLISWLSRIADTDGLAPEVKTVVLSTIRQLAKNV